jgi:hypothetical protein
MFEDTKITRRHNLKRDSQYTGQRDKNDQQILHRKLKIEQHEVHYKNGSELRSLRKVSRLRFTNATRRFTHVKHPVTSQE